MKRLLFICVFLIQSVFVFAQNDTIALIHSFNSSKGMQIKWLPTSYDVFLSGFKNGYNLYRAEVLSVNGGEERGEFIKLNSLPITYWSAEKLKQEYAKDSALATAGIFIDGANELLNRSSADNMQDAIERARGNEMLHLISSFATIADNGVAEALGMYYLDNTYIPGKKYLYKIEVPGNEKLTSYALTFPDTDAPKEKVMGLTAKLYPGAVHLNWYNNGNKTFPYYNIYRSEKKKGKYEKLNKIPYVGNFGNAKFNKNTTAFTDSFPSYNTTYYYKVAGVNAFEEEGTPSDIMEVTTFYMLRTAPVITSSDSPDNKTITVNWTVEDFERPFIKGFSVKRAKKGEGPYNKLNEKMLSPKTFTFTDETKKGASNYYVVTAYGEGGDSVTSVLKSHLLVDSFPPAKPTVISGTCDTNGVITLSWKNNSEEDLEGYRIFKVNDLRHEPVRVISGHTPDTVLVDTVDLKRPYNKVYYRVVALDAVFNASVPSDFYEVVLPDKNPPKSGYLKTYSVGMKGVTISWQPSNTYDLNKMYLMRKGETDYDFKPILELKNDSLRISSYTDTTTKSGQTYSYAVLAEDASGLQSKLSNIFTVDQFKRNSKIPVSNLEAFVSKENKMIKLTWDFPQNAKGFRIYRSRNNDPLTTYEYVKGDQREFYDKWLKPRSDYTYLIIAELKGGFKSGYSNKLEVKY